MGKKLLLTIIGLLIAVVLVLSVRGLYGSPDIETLNSSNWVATGPFESSNDRGRFALTYSFLEDHTLKFSPAAAQFATPDLAVTERGEYVSLFAPGVSFLVIPGYLLGKHFGAAQVGVFGVVAVVALCNVFLIYAIARRLGASTFAAVLGGLTFLFATPAFTYAVSLSQHHFSVFSLLLAIYLLIRYNNWGSLSIVWLLCAFSVVIDNPNLFFLFPVGVYGLARIISLQFTRDEIYFEVKSLRLLTLLAMLLPIVFLGWFNKNSNGSVGQLSGTLERILSVNQQDQEIQTDEERLFAKLAETNSIQEASGKEKTAVGFFKTRNLLNGFDVHFTSHDRGILWFTPVILLGVFGIIILSRSSKMATTLFVSVIGTNVLLYSMWGDPWGGWAFGSRYLIPSYALLSIGLSLALTSWRKSWIFLPLFSVLFIYSVRVNTLGALGTSVIPPLTEVLALEETTGRVEKYDYERSRDYLREVGSKSFVYQTWLQEKISAYEYYALISSVIIGIGITLLILLVCL